MNVEPTWMQRPSNQPHRRSGAMTAAMQALPGAGGPRLLRIGVVQGGRVLEDRIIRERRAVTVGASERADFVIASDEIGTTVSLFETDGPDYFLHVSEGMTGRVALEGGIAEDHPRRRHVPVRARPAPEVTARPHRAARNRSSARKLKVA